MQVFFISKAIEGQLISTGAFEVVFNCKNINSPGLDSIVNSQGSHLNR